MSTIDFALCFYLPQSLEPLARTVDAAVQENWDRAELYTGVDPPSGIPIDEPERPAPGAIAAALIDAAGPPSRELERELPPGAEPVRLHPDPVHFGGEITFSPFTHETLGIGGVVSDALGGEGELRIAVPCKAFAGQWPEAFERAVEERVLDSVKRDGGGAELFEERIASLNARLDRFRVSPSGVGVSTAPFVLGHALRLLQRARLVVEETTFGYLFDVSDDPVDHQGSLSWIPPTAPASALVASFEAQAGQTVDTYFDEPWYRPFVPRPLGANRRPPWRSRWARGWHWAYRPHFYTPSEEALARADRAAERSAEEIMAEWAYRREWFPDEGEDA